MGQSQCCLRRHSPSPNCAVPTCDRRGSVTWTHMLTGTDSQKPQHQSYLPPFTLWTWFMYSADKFLSSESLNPPCALQDCQAAAEVECQACCQAHAYVCPLEKAGVYFYLQINLMAQETQGVDNEVDLKIQIFACFVQWANIGMRLAAGCR